MKDCGGTGGGDRVKDGGGLTRPESFSATITRKRKFFCYHQAEAGVEMEGRTESKTVGENARASRAFVFVIDSAQQATRVFFCGGSLTRPLLAYLFLQHHRYHRNCHQNEPKGGREGGKS